MITYAALMGAIALGLALAFGLGGRDVARRLLETAYAKGQREAGQVKRDIQQGKERAKADAERMRDDGSAHTETSASSTTQSTTMIR